MSVNDLQDWAKDQIANANASVETDDQFVYIKWKANSELVGHICIENRKPFLYIISFQLNNEMQNQGVFTSFAAFIPGYAREQGFTHLGVISANLLMRELLAKCGFKRGIDPDDYFVDISMEDSPPEQYGNTRP